MTDTPINQYLPDYIVTPGEIIDEYLDFFGMTQVDLSNRTGLPKKTINGIINGSLPITPETACKLGRALGRPAHFWNSIEKSYGI